MLKKTLVFFIIATILGLTGYVVVDFLQLDNKINPDNSIISPVLEKFEEEAPIAEINSELAEKETLNILLLGIDRRSKLESAYRTDIMILMSINTKDNVVLLTSVPRDLWYKSGRLNAIYIQQGWEGIQTAFATIAGMEPDAFILTDFEDFSWIVDALGGVEVDVETTFTDSSYPVDATKTYQTVKFTAGPEKMTGKRALIFSRSRKGDFDNGDWGRMRRQHLLLKGMVAAATQPSSLVCKEAGNTTGDCTVDVSTKVIENIFKTLTTGKMDTNLGLNDAKYLWKFYNERGQYTVESLIMDYEYLHTPDASNYGGAWVLAPVGNNYAKFQSDFIDKLTGVNQEEETASIATTTEEQPQNDEAVASPQN